MKETMTNQDANISDLRLQRLSSAQPEIEKKDG